MKKIDKCVLDGLNLSTLGLEISPLYRPTTDRSIHSVHYTDYTSSDDSRMKHAHYEHPEIMDLDYIWTPGKKLSECVPAGTRYNWVIASHVLEHVPDPLGWILEVFDVMEDGGVFSLVLPDKRGTFDRNRRTSEVSDLLHAWLSHDKRPNTKQLYDFLSNVTSEDGWGNVLSEHHYTKKESLDFVINSYLTGQYFDAHCSVFTSDSFVELINELSYLGVLNVSISTPIEKEDEFYVQLKKTGEPAFQRPSPPDKKVNINIDELIKHATHMDKAYQEAVDLQDDMKKRIAELESDKNAHRKPRLFAWFFRKK